MYERAQQGAFRIGTGAMSSAVDVGTHTRPMIEKLTERLTVVLGGVLAAYLIAISGYQWLGVDLSLTVFLPPLLFAACIYGVWYGFAASLLAVALLGPLMPLTPQPLTMDATKSVLVMALYFSVAWAGGVYAGSLRQRRQDESIREVLRVSGPQPDQALPALVAESFIGGRQLGFAHHALQTILTSGASIALVITMAVVSREIASPPALMVQTLILMAPVVAAGAMYGPWTGALAGLAAGLLQAWLPAASPLRLAPMSGDVLGDIMLFGGVGLIIGVFSAQTQRRHLALQGLLVTGGALSRLEDENDIRRIVFAAAREACAGGYVQLSDANGQVLHGAARPKADANQGDWRSRRLVADGRDVGELRWRTSRFFRDDQAAVDGAMGMIADLGAAALMRARLKFEKAEMESVARTEQLRTILLDAVSHHFRTPLSSILGSVTNLLDHGGQHDAKASHDFLLIIREQANRLNRYVENFLSVARLESGSIEIKPRPTDLELIVNDVWDSFGEAGGARRYLEVQITDRKVQVDPEQMKQVLGNLLENAIKYSTEDTLVSVTARPEGGVMVLEVTDQGAGVPPNDIGHIFGRFYRSRQAKATGLGLGLYITKSLVEMMGGTIEAENRTDGTTGVTMRVRLPLAGAGS